MKSMKKENYRSKISSVRSSQTEFNNMLRSHTMMRLVLSKEDKKAFDICKSKKQHITSIESRIRIVQYSQ